MKKTIDGIYLYFAHNTDSFAIASMTSEDKEPISVLSRQRPSSINYSTSGGRAMHATVGKQDKASKRLKKGNNSDPSHLAQTRSTHFVYTASRNPDGKINWQQSSRGFGRDGDDHEGAPCEGDSLETPIVL